MTGLRPAIQPLVLGSLVTACLQLASPLAVAAGHGRLEVGLHYSSGGSVDNCGPAAVELWSDPPAGALVRPGDLATIYVRPVASGFVSVFSVDTKGCTYRLFPGRGDDGWVPAGETVRLPTHGSGALRFMGPPGVEYVFATVSLDPWRRSEWMSWETSCHGDRCGSFCSAWGDDPFGGMRGRCYELLPDPERTERYAAAWLSFCVGHRPHDLCRPPRHDHDCVRTRCGPACPTFRFEIGVTFHAGPLDLRAPCAPAPRRARGRGDWKHERGRHEVRSTPRCEDSPQPRRVRRSAVDDDRGERDGGGRDRGDRERVDGDRRDRERRADHRDRGREDRGKSRASREHADRERGRSR